MSDTTIPQKTKAEQIREQLELARMDIRTHFAGVPESVESIFKTIEDILTPTQPNG